MSKLHQHPRQPPRRRAHRKSRRERTYRPVALALAITFVGLGITFWQHNEASGSGGTRSLESRALARSVSLGPEGVPIPAAPVLAGPGEPAVGGRVDGISCGAIEELAFHVHAHLAIFVSGRQRRVPAGVGIGAPRTVVPAPGGAFVAGGACFSWLHTHAADGIIHIESPVQRAFTLGEFFDVWKQPLGRRRVGSKTGRVTAFLDGRPYYLNPRDIPLTRHAQVQLDIGRPAVAPVSVRFPQGL
jgi:hypothetical protein